MREGEKRIAELSTQSLLIVELLNPNISFRYLTVWEKKKDFSEKSAYRASPGLPLKAPDRGESSKPRSREDQEEIASDPVCTRTAAHQSNPTRACAPELSKTEMHALPASPPSAASSSLQDMLSPLDLEGLGATLWDLPRKGASSLLQVLSFGVGRWRGSSAVLLRQVT